MEEHLRIIQNICGDVEQRLRSCRSKTIAEHLTERMCSEIAMNCQSDIIRHALKVYVDKLVGQIFDKNGNNNYLEKKDAKKTHND